MSYVLSHSVEKQLELINNCCCITWASNMIRDEVDDQDLIISVVHHRVTFRMRENELIVSHLLTSSLVVQWLVWMLWEWDCSAAISRFYCNTTVHTRKKGICRRHPWWRSHWYIYPIPAGKVESFFVMTMMEPLKVSLRLGVYFFLYISIGTGM